MAIQTISPEIETLLISEMIKSHENMEKAIFKLNLNHFGMPIIKDIFYEIIESYKKYNSILTKPELELKIKDKFSNKQIALEYLNKIYDTPSSNNIESLIGIIKEKSKLRRLIDMSSRIGKKVEAGDISNVDDEIFKYLENDSSDSDFNVISVVDNAKNFLQTVMDQRNNPEKFDGCITGFNGLDKVITGLKKSEFGLFVAKTGGGKSTVMNNVSAANLLYGKNILYFIIESPPIQYSFNIYSCLAGVPAAQFHEGKAKDEDILAVHKTIQKVKKLGGNLYFVDAPQNLTVTNLQMEIRKAKRKYGRIDLVMIDYIQIMETKSVNPYDWNNLVGISKQIKAVARAEAVPIWSAVQEVKEREQDDGKKQKEHSVADIAYAKGISDNCDLVVKLYQNSLDKVNNQFMFYILKARRAKNLQDPINVYCDLGKQQIDVRSMKKLKEEILDKVVL